MAAHRYWRITGLLVQGATLELTDAMLLVDGAVPTPAPTLTATFAPVSGSLSTLLNGDSSDAVSWPVATVRSPGFALVFDCGADSTVEFPGLRLGAGSSRATFPMDVTIQFSDDGLFWGAYQSYSDLTYPGNFTLTSFLPSGGDTYFSSVSLLLDGSSFTDLSPTPNVLTAVGGVAVSTTNSKHGGASLFFDGTGDYLLFTASQLIGTGDFTIECSVRLITTSVDCEILCIGGVTGLSQYDLVFECKAGGALRGSLQNGAGGVQLDITTAAGLLSVNTWHHVAFAVSGSSAKLFIGGGQSASGTVTGTRVQNRSDCRIGYLSDVSPYDRSYSGYIDDLRVTKGVGRYTGVFTPPTSAFPTTPVVGYGVLVTDSPSARGIRFSSTVQLISGADIDPFSAYPLKTLGYTASDMENGGTGRIYGTTKEKNTPANTPLSRRVLLVDERSQLVIRQTWSETATGEFEFRDLAMDRPYTTISYDHLRNYRAVIADNQLPELQA